MSEHTGQKARHYFARARKAGAAILRCVLSFVLLASMAPTVHAGSRTSADFLKIPIGANGAGLGQAYTAITEGVDSINWNPAGLASTPAFASNPTVGLSLTHQQHLVDTSLDHLGLALPSRPGRDIALGLNVVRLSYGTQDRRDVDRRKIGSFDASDLAVGVAAAHRFGDALIGGQLKVIQQQYAGASARGFALDFGLQAPGPIDRMNVGLSVRNLGPQMKFVQESYRLPLTLSLGTAYRVTGPLSLLMDVHARPYQDQVNLSAGAEFAASRSVTLRAGYLARLAEAVPNTQQGETKQGALGGLYGVAAGMGLKFGQFAMDYAITPFGELGNAQTLTLASWFGGDTFAPRATEADGVSNAPGDGRSILILPMDHERWWDDLR
jgi:hypothetical protein